MLRCLTSMHRYLLRCTCFVTCFATSLRYLLRCLLRCSLRQLKQDRWLLTASIFDAWLPRSRLSLVTSTIALIATSLVISFVAWELGRLHASIYSRRYSLGCSMLRCFDTSLECIGTRFDNRVDNRFEAPLASILPCWLLFGHLDNRFDRTLARLYHLSLGAWSLVASILASRRFDTDFDARLDTRCFNASIHRLNASPFLSMLA